MKISEYIQGKRFDFPCYCIYKIKNLINSKVYIGLTKNIDDRIRTHLICVRDKSYDKSIIHRSIRKHGCENFEINILTTCSSLKEANQKEIELIDFFKSADREYGYNLTLGGKVGKPNRENILKRRRRSTRKRPVARYTVEGNIIDTFESVMEASRQLNLNQSCIHRVSRTNNTTGGFMFKKYTNHPQKKIEPYIDNTGKNLIEYTKKHGANNKIKCKAINLKTGEEFYADSLLELSNKIGVHKTTIFRILKNENHKKWKIIKLQES